MFEHDSRVLTPSSGYGLNWESGRELQISAAEEEAALSRSTDKLLI
jgi:hypothetical protein